MSRDDAVRLDDAALPHAQSAEDVLLRYRSAREGLTQADAGIRLSTWGPNQLPSSPRKSALVRLLLQFHNALIYVLLGSALITALLQHWTDTAVIIAVVLVNALLGFLQEGRAEKAMEAVRRMLAPMASVIRDGRRQAIPAQELVPGDVVVLEAGDRVPADVRLLTSHGLMVQEAILTGESVPVEKQTRPVAGKAPLGDRRCMAYSGTLITRGQGRGLVTGTGSQSEIGRISGLLSAVEQLVTPLVRQMNIFARWLTLFILVVASLILVYGFFVQGQPFAELFMAVVGLSVAAIPEGLPAVLTITLAIGVQAMARRNAIVRRLPAIETLGAVSVICTDKTGTLTCNEMMVAAVELSGHSFTLTGSGYVPDGNLLRDNAVAAASDISRLERLARVAQLCNDAQLHEQDACWTIDGDPMEAALLVLAHKLGIQAAQLQQRWTRTDAIPFDAQHRFMATLNHSHRGEADIFVKGAPETLLAMCDRQWHGDTPVPLDPDYWRDHFETLASQGLRVLALASKEMPPEHTVLNYADVQQGLCLVGLVGLIDPPRPEAIEAVAQCHRAGIGVKMITGDHAGTAMAIARQVGLKQPDGVLTGQDLDGLSDAELSVRMRDTDVFARTSPEHKLRLVMALQANGLTVAMTGDGVNDAPALKRADAGIAMGRKGSESAREAADLVLADDNFASIVAAIREGRTVYDNLKKVIGWTLPTNSGEALTIIVALLAGTTMPVTPVQILWINLITAITLGIALAFEPTEEGTMSRPPRRRDESLLSSTLVWHIILVSILFLCGVYGIFSYALNQGYSIELARTMAVNTLVVMEIFHLFFMRNFYSTSLTLKAVMGTPVVWLTVGLVTLAQFAVTYIPALQQLLGTEAVSLLDGLIIVALGVVLFVLIELEKQLRLRGSLMRIGASSSD